MANTLINIEKQIGDYVVTVMENDAGAIGVEVRTSRCDRDRQQLDILFLEKTTGTAAKGAHVAFTRVQLVLNKAKTGCKARILGTYNDRGAATPITGAFLREQLENIDVGVREF